ncbi:alpha/beta hydrolase [Cronobacter sp. JZ38]|uniref:alpha/beta hydrolase n=1 Tax=Cronobacter sp. JZ38 TaxID=1906275 RepID=UPI0012A2CB2A|nr:alpha/beta hydrolase [Cronobacter sp. JZ38]EKS1844931.1 alpha/beta hydrolase [Cronobacter muytjensii]ELY3983658.1 alpha/beta hydrolase [Cronobacter muytjensii]ELY4520149.1 alpha/beta hydrolase [Cronobacter muytjensii]ELY4663216.1 alpha/beta hydrolase [Cronobacter muytjensii]
MSEQTEIVNGVQIKYRFKKRKYDTQHMLFIFSGFGGAGMFTYDFANALQDCPAYVVWIKDDFNDACTYYLCQNNDFSVEQAVITFIENMLARYGLDKTQCTLAGFSKGGSAALWYGLKYAFKNIVATVPQFHIGSYAQKNWPEVFTHMTGDKSEASAHRLDTLLPCQLSADTAFDKNIYLLTSEADCQYESEVKPYIPVFRKYQNFNLFMAQSMLIREHNQVTSYHVPLLLGIFYSLSQGAVPRFGDCALAADNRVLPRPLKPEPVAVLKKIAVNGARLFPEGVAVLKGLSCAEYPDIQVDLVCKNEGCEEVFRIAKAHRTILTRQLYDEGFVNYDKGWFCTARYEGLSLAALPAGTYQLWLDITCQQTGARKALETDAALANRVLAASEALEVFSEGTNVYLTRKAHS